MGKVSCPRTQHNVPSQARSWTTHSRVEGTNHDATVLPTLIRVHTGPGKPGKSWNFIMAFSRTGKSWKVLEICLTQQKDMKWVEGSKENQN